MNLTDKVCVVTGASSGLGLKFSEALIDKGAQVYGLARRLQKLQELQDALGARFHPVACDVRHEDEVKEAFRDIIREAGRIDVLVNNAGLGQFGAVDELTLEDWEVQMNTNLRGVFLCTREAVAPMKQQNAESGFGGHIVNIASIAGLLGNPGLGAYNASKFGLRGFSESLMKELRDDGIKVTCLYPGSVETDFSNTVGSRSSSTTQPMQAADLAATLVHVLETPDNYLISEVVMRPLRPRG